MSALPAFDRNAFASKDRRFECAGRIERAPGLPALPSNPWRIDTTARFRAPACKHLTQLSKDIFVHPSSFVDEPCEIGAGTKIWHFSHVMKGARIGERC